MLYNQQNDIFVNKAHSVNIFECHSKCFRLAVKAFHDLFPADLPVFSLNTCPSHSCISQKDLFEFHP